jgi:hypothetical protein
VALRASDELSEEELTYVLTRLGRLDKASKHGAWTLRTLALIEEHPGVRAIELATLEGRAKLDFKIDVRKLKALGLTESLPLGYQLSPRGQAVLDRARQRR